jgi:PilZ domain
MERRRRQRTRTLKSARILLNHHHSVIDCTVRNLSETGACLNVASAVGIPPEFDVFFEADRTIRPCRLVWHKEKQVGVEFAEGEVTHLTAPVTTSA